MAETLDLHLILDALEVGDGRAEVNLLALQRIGEGVTHAVGVDEHHFVLIDALQEVNDVVIFADSHPAVLEVLAHLVGHLVLIDEQLLVVMGNKGKGDGNRREIHVVAAQVQQPGNVVEGGHQHCGGFVVLEHLEQAFDFCIGFLAGILHVMDKGRFTGARGAVSPNLVGRIELGGKHEAVLTAEAFQLVGSLSAIQSAVDSNDRIFFEHLLQPLMNGRVIAHVLLHHDKAAVFQFDFCLQEVA